MNIHTSAIIHPSARIGQNCTIEAGAVIGPNTIIGDNCRIAHYAVVGGQSQDLKYSGEPTYLSIGDNCTIGEFATIHRATFANDFTKLGNNVSMLAYSHVAHDCRISDNVIIGHRADIGGHAYIEHNANIGANAQVVHFARIGRFAFITANTFINHNVLPFAIADSKEGKRAHIRSFNKIGLGRATNHTNNQATIKSLFRQLAASEEPLVQSILALDDSPESRIITEFVASSIHAKPNLGLINFSEKIELDEDQDDLEDCLADEANYYLDLKGE